MEGSGSRSRVSNKTVKCEALDEALAKAAADLLRSSRSRATKYWKVTR